ncbi:MAG: M56 family metallopeptidase, partial [Candidatus Hydrogenedentes bacterium]|nr:M56 family metallopeptidase [Candidatus Hydrogenedentota bacterium]
MPELIDVTNEFAARWAGVMWAAVWQSSVLAAAILGITLLLRRFSPSLRYWLWMLVVLRLLVVPLGTVSLPILPALNESIDVDGSAAAKALLTKITATPGGGGFGAGAGSPGLSTAELAPASSSPQQVEPARTLPKPSLLTIVFAVWVLGILAAAGRLAWTWSQTRRIVHHATAPSRDARLSTLASRIAYAMGLRRAPRIGVTECSVSPFVFGVFQPVVILPRQLVERADDGQLAAVLAHEFAHLRRFDPLFGWLFSLCHAAYFFHPALILVKRQLLIERERACDDYALAMSKARPSAYARALVSVAELCSAPATAVGPLLVVAESFADLKTRLVALQRQTRPQARLSIGALVVLIALGTITVPGIALTNRASELSTPVAHDVEESFQVAQAPVARVAPTRIARESARPQPIPADGRVLHFPSDRTLGTIRIMDSSFERKLDTFYHWLDDSEWIDWSTAQGDVVVPQGKHVWLVLNPRACGDLSGLQQLHPNDLFKLSVDYTERGGPSLDDT